MYYLVYKITNNVNGKIYIGVHKTEDRNDGYVGSGKILKRAIKKYGIEHFTKEILYECKSKKEMFQREANIVDEEFVARKDTYNIKLGGFGGWDYLNNGSESHIKRCSKAGKIGIKSTLLIFQEKLKNDPEFLKKHNERSSKILKDLWKNGSIGDGFAGRKHTRATKRKIGAANSIHQMGKGNSQYGKCWVYSFKEKKSITIRKEDLEKYLEDGWIKGRKMSFD
jgi:group I intron endonuclease